MGKLNTPLRKYFRGGVVFRYREWGAGSHRPPAPGQLAIAIPSNGHCCNPCRPGRRCWSSIPWVGIGAMGVARSFPVDADLRIRLLNGELRLNAQKSEQERRVNG